jgi:hypothetical protein
MAFQMRQAARKSVHRAVWINVGDGQPLRKCMLVDLSDSGAKLEFEDNDEMPNTFSLLLSRFGQSHTACRVAWRRDNAIGVHFVHRRENKIVQKI